MIIPGFPTPFISSGAAALDIDATGSVNITVGNSVGDLGVRPGYYGSVNSNTLLSVNGSYQSINRIITFDANTGSARNYIIISLDEVSWATEVADYLEANYTSFEATTASIYEASMSWGFTTSDELIILTSFSGLPHTGFVPFDVGFSYTMEFTV